MKAKDYTLKALNSIYHQDPWVQELYNAAGIYADDLAELLDIVYNNYFFDTANLATVKRLEKELGLVPLSRQIIEDRRKNIESKWKSASKASVALLQAVADSWYKDGILVDFIDGKLLYQVQTGYIMLNLKYIFALLNEKKPAHLGYLFQNILSGEGEIKAGGVLTSSKLVNILPDLDFDFELEQSSIYACGFVRMAKIIEI